MNGRRGQWLKIADAGPIPVGDYDVLLVATEKDYSAMRYDRVQGLSLGVGYQVRVPGVRFTGLYGTVRYGFSDERVTGRLTLLRDAPGGRLAISGYREMGDIDPFAQGHELGNTLNALFAGHDNGDYPLAQGGSDHFGCNRSRRDGEARDRRQ